MVHGAHRAPHQHVKWALLGAVAGVCVGLATKAFFWSLAGSGKIVRGIRLGPLPYYVLLPLALPACVWLIRIAAAVMGIELLPGDIGVYAALAAGTAFLLVGHRSVYASQKIGLSKSAGLDVRMDVRIGELTRSGLRIREGSLTGRVLRRCRRVEKGPGTPET